MRTYIGIPLVIERIGHCEYFHSIFMYQKIKKNHHKKIEKQKLNKKIVMKIARVDVFSKILFLMAHNLNIKNSVQN